MRRTRDSRAGLLALLVSVALLLFVCVPGVASAALKDKVASVLQRYGMAGSGTSVAVFDLTDKDYVYQLRPDVLRLPASNEKLVTSSAALALWSATYRFATQVFVDVAPDDEGVVRGNVYLRGLGDPTFSTRSFAERRWDMETGDVQDLVRSLRTLGVTRVTGGVVADDGYFDGLRRVTTWRPSMSAYCAPLAALTINASCGNGGYVTDPPLAAATSLTRRLRTAGVRVAHAPVRGFVPATATLVYTEQSAPLSRVLAKMNKPSDNFLAEEILKGLGAGFGAGGTTSAGARVAGDYLQSIGIDGGFRLRDGSGLSYQDRLTARTVLKILGEMARRPDFSVFSRSLAVGGVDGTLEHRMRGTAAAGNARAKTGTLNDASSLSGYLTASNGHVLSFSMLMNGHPLDVTRAQAAQDAVAALLARSSP
jgi:D-alanyl-D-alanine carboxypeptidase/D-alanyl-D-alanine-endopeptidase (penicillin-binding protein 4)